MSPEQEQRLQRLEDLLASLVKSDRYLFARNLQYMDGRDVQLGQGTGSKIGTGVNQKLGFFGNTPVVQQNAINSPSGGAVVDVQARLAIGNIIASLQNLGLNAT